MTKTTTKRTPRAKTPAALSKVGLAVMGAGMTAAQFDTQTLSDAGVACPINNPRTGMPSGVEVIVHGMHSKRFRVALAEQARQVMAIRELNGDKDLTDDETFEQTLSLLAACTSAFVNLFDAEGNPQAYSLEFAKEFYRKSPLARREVDVFLANHTNFLLA